MFTAEELQKKIEIFRKMPSETEWLEFKEARNSYSFDKLGKYFSALSNEANLKQKQSGWLIFGIKDKLPRDIAGTRYRPDRKSLESLKHEVDQVRLQNRAGGLEQLYRPPGLHPECQDCCNGKGGSPDSAKYWWFLRRNSRGLCAQGTDTGALPQSLSGSGHG